MQRIQDCKREKRDTSRMMNARLVQFVIESSGVFEKSQLVKIFLPKIDKRLLDLAMPRIILDYRGRATLEQAFIEVERCDRALYQHDITNMVAWMIDATKFGKTSIATTNLANTQLKKLLYCWKCREAGHTKKDPNCPQFPKKTQPLDKSKKKEEVVRFEVKTTKK